MHELRFNFVYKQCTDLLKKKKKTKETKSYLNIFNNIKKLLSERCC